MKWWRQQREGEAVLKVRLCCAPHRKTWILTQWGILIAFTSSSGAARSPDDGWCVLTGRWTSPVLAGHVRASGGVFALMWVHTYDLLGTLVCVCTALKHNLLPGGGTPLNNLTGKTNKAENTGCTGDTVLRFMSQSCLIVFTASRAAPPELSASYARLIFITAAIDFNCVVNRHTPTRLSASPSFSSPSSLCIDSYFSKHFHLHGPITFLARPALQQSAVMRRQPWVSWLLQMRADKPPCRKVWSDVVFVFASEKREMIKKDGVGGCEGN